jgi:hypothetical protein
MKHNTQQRNTATTCDTSHVGVLPQLLPKPAENPAVENLRSKGGPPSGNQNRATHFLNCSGWPADAIQDRRHVAALGRALRQAVLDCGTLLDVVTLATIQTAMRWEKHARLAGRWLRKEAATLTPDQRLAFSRESARASAERDKAIAALGLKRPSERSPWDVLDAMPATNGQDHNHQASDATAGPSVAQEGEEC